MPADAAVPHGGRRDLNRQRTRRALSDAAVSLVAQHGLDHVTVEMIADLAEVSPRTFSNYFTGKEDAILAEDPEPDAVLHAAFRAQPPELPLLVALRAALVLVAEQAGQEPERRRLLMQLVRSEPRLMPAFHARFGSREETLTAVIAQRLDVDPGLDRRPALLAGVLTTVIRRSMQQQAGAADSDLPTLVGEGFDLLVTTLSGPA